MKKVRATIAVFALFSLACVGNQVTYKLLDTGEPLGGLDSDADSDADSDTDSDAVVLGFEGSILILYGYRPTPGDYECEWYFNTTGTPTEMSCPECEWTLKFELIYDSERSVDTGDCGETASREWTMGYDADYGGDAGYEVIWYYFRDYAEWNPIWGAYSDGVGGLVFGGGQLDYYYLDNDVPYYYTLYWYGYGTLSY